MRQLKLSFITVIIVFLSFVTTTYAWLALSTVNTISSIELNALDSYQLEISVDGINYYETLKADLLIPYIKDLKFDAVTTTDGINFTRREDDFVKANENYLNIKFHFRTTNRRYTEIYLAGEQTVNNDKEYTKGSFITSEGRNFKNDIDYYYNENELIKAGTIKKYYAKDAMRLSFNSTDLESAKIFDLSGNEERGFGYMYGAHDYYMRKTSKILTPPVAPETIYELSKFSTKDPIALDDASYLLSLKDNNDGYYTGSIEMNAWLEGWDADAFDAIFKDIVKIQLEFKAVMPRNLFE